MILDTCQALASMPPDRVAAVFNSAFTGHPIFERPLFRFLPVPYEADMRDLNHVYDGAWPRFEKKTIRAVEPH